MKKFAFLLAFLITFVSGGISLFQQHRPPGGVAALPLPPLERQQPPQYQTATFALG